jgi:hypothetical protein
MGSLFLSSLSLSLPPSLPPSLPRSLFVESGKSLAEGDVAGREGKEGGTEVGNGGRLGGMEGEIRVWRGIETMSVFLVLTARLLRVASLKAQGETSAGTSRSNLPGPSNTCQNGGTAGSNG